MVTHLEDYHYFNRGATPGMISLRHQDGTVYGPWPAKGLAGEGGVTNAYWVVEPMVVIKAGTYIIVDSDPSTWSYNSASSNAGLSLIQGFRAALLGVQPELAIRETMDHRLEVSWQASAVGFVLESAENLRPPIAWQTVTNTPIQIGDRITLPIEPAVNHRFYRLHKP